MSSPVAIHVALAEKDVSPAEREELARSVESYARDLLEGLALPLRPEVSVALEPETEPGRLPFRVTIDGRPCRLGPWESRSDGPAAKRRRLIQVALVMNRRLFLRHPDVQDFVRATYAEASAEKGIPKDALPEICEHLVDRLLSLERLQSGTLAPAAPLPTDVRPLFEELVADVGVPSVGVTYNRRYAEHLEEPGRDAQFEEMFTLMQDGLFYELGVVFPKIQWSDDASLADDEFVVQLNDVPLPKMRGLTLGECLVNDTPDRLSLLNIEASEAINPGSGSAAAIISEGDAKVCEQAGLTTWDALGYLILDLSVHLRRHARCFLPLDMVRHNLESLAEIVPSLVQTARERNDDYQIAWVLHDLVGEEISIRDLSGILEALLAVDGEIDEDLSDSIVFAPLGTSPLFSVVHADRPAGFPHVAYAERVRGTALARHISYKYTRGGSTLVVYLLDPGIERRLRRGLVDPLTPDERDAILDAVHGEVGGGSPTTYRPVVLTTSDVRRTFRELIEVEFPFLNVVSYTELVPDMNIQPLARISLA